MKIIIVMIIIRKLRIDIHLNFDTCYIFTTKLQLLQ